MEEVTEDYAKKQQDIFDELTGGGTMAGIMALMIGAKMRKGLILIDEEKPRI